VDHTETSGKEGFKKKPILIAVFEPVAFVFVSIFFALVHLGGLAGGILTPAAASIGLRGFGIPGHVIGILYMIYIRNTKAAMVLLAFLGFWIIADRSLSTLPTAELNALLMLAEAAMVVFLVVMQRLYKGELKKVLIVIIGAVVWLFTTKVITVIPGYLTMAILWLVAGWVLFLASNRIERADAKAKAKAEAVVAAEEAAAEAQAS
jgi:hypothetical protein